MTTQSGPSAGIGNDQIKPGAIERDRLDTKDSGEAVVVKIIAGAGITLSSSGADPGTGDVVISATAAAAVITLLPHSVQLPTFGKNYTLIADFSAQGQFADACFQPVLLSGNPKLIISPNFALWTPSRAAWTLYVPTDLAAYSPAQVTLTAAIAGRGWTGASAVSVAASWTGPTLIN